MSFLFLGVGLFLGSIFGVVIMSLCHSAKLGDSMMQATDVKHPTEDYTQKYPLPFKAKNQNILPVIEMLG